MTQVELAGHSLPVAQSYKQSKNWISAPLKPQGVPLCSEQGAPLRAAALTQGLMRELLMHSTLRKLNRRCAPTASWAQPKCTPQVSHLLSSVFQTLALGGATWLILANEI